MNAVIDEKTKFTVLIKLSMKRQRKNLASIIKVLVQYGVDVNAVDNLQRTALYYAAAFANIPCVLHLLCCGAHITEDAMKDDDLTIIETREKLLSFIKKRLDDKTVKSELMSDEERQFIRSLGFALVNVKLKVLWWDLSTAKKAFYKIREYITFKNIFMAHGYRLGTGSLVNDEYDEM